MNAGEKEDVAYFAWTYPYSFEETLKKTKKLMTRFQNHESIYMHREVLYYSREHRPMELITFTDKTGITDEREDTIEGLFPEHSETDEANKRPFKFDKPTVFLSCRVHPGETPASYVLAGIFNFLSNEKSAQAKVLRERFVFKIVPVLNPDGVYRGYFRLDTLAQNLNRYYTNPTSDKQPTIWAVKHAIEQQKRYGKLQIYVDLHAHASKRGCFMFGNSLQGEAQLQNMLLPKLVSLNSLNFDFMECNFSDKLMQCKDKKDGLTREGCGRVSIMKLTELANCYTLECNYASGRRVNHISNKLIIASGQQESEIPITDSKSKFYSENCTGFNANGTNSTLKQSPSYTIEVFEDIGRAFCIGLLDFYSCNPVSRLPMSIYKNIEGVKSDILSHNPIFLPKKQAEEIKNPVKGKSGAANRIGLNSKAIGTRSQQQTKSLQRNQTQRGQLSAAPTAAGDTTQSTSTTAITSSFANRLSQKQAAMVKQNSQVSEPDGKTILNSVRSKQQGSVDIGPNKFKSANTTQLQDGKKLENFVRQIKPLKQQASKNPNLNHQNRTIFQHGESHKTAPGSSKNPAAHLLTRSEKNFKGAPYENNAAGFPYYYQHMQQQMEQGHINIAGEGHDGSPDITMPPIDKKAPPKPKRKNFDDREANRGCSDFSSGCGSNQPSIYEHEDDIMYQRQHIHRTRHSSESQARLHSLASSDGLSDSEASACADESAVRSAKKKVLANSKRANLLPPSRTELPEKSHSPKSRTTLSPGLAAQSHRQSMYNKPTPPPNLKERVVTDVSEISKAGTNEVLFATDDNLAAKLAKQNQLSNPSHKRKNSDKTKRHHALPADNVSQFQPTTKPHKIKSHLNHDDIGRSCSQSGETHNQQFKQNLSEVCPRDAHFEDESTFKTNCEDGTSQSMLPHTRGNDQHTNQNRLQHQGSSSIAASEYASQQAPLPHVSYNAQKRQKMRPENQNHRPMYHEPTYRFDRGNSDLVKSIAQSTVTTNAAQPIHGISTKSSFAGGFLKGSNLPLANMDVDAQTLQEQEFTRQQFSLMKKLINKPLTKNARGHSMNKKAESIEQAQFSDEFGPTHKDIQLQKLLKEQQRNSCAVDKRRRTSESQKHQNAALKTNSASHTSAKYKQFYNRKQVDGISLGNGSQATISQALGGLMPEHGFTSPEMGEGPISQNQTQHLTKKYSNHQHRNKNVKMTGSNTNQKVVSDPQQSAGMFTYFRMPTPPDQTNPPAKSLTKKLAGGISSQSPSTGTTPKPPYHLPGNTSIQEQQMLMQQAQQQQLFLMNQDASTNPSMYPGFETEESLFPQISQQSSGTNPSVIVQNQGQPPSFSTLRKNAHKRQHQTSTMTQPQQALLLNQNRSLSLLGNSGVAAPTCSFPAQFNNAPGNHVVQTRSMSNNVPKPSHLNKQSKSPRGQQQPLHEQKIEFPNRIDPISEKATKYAMRSSQQPNGAAAARRKRNTLQLAKEASQRMLDNNMQVEGTQQSQLYNDPSTSQFFQGSKQKYGHAIRGPPPPENWKSSSQKY